jgi:lipopolysaccharide export system ATP-binding protein
LKGPALLVVEGLTVRIGATPVVSSVSLEVAAGEVVGVLGPSGAGKSTLLAALAGERALASGRALLKGEDLGATPLWQRARRGLGYLPQTPSVLWDLTVDENLRVFSSLATASGTLERARCELEAIGLEGRRRVRARDLSGGERRRLEIVRALSTAPDVLLCDEPFAALDPEGKAAVSSRLAALAEAGACVLISDHDVGAALACCRRAYLLLDGRIEVEAPSREFAADPKVVAHYTHGTRFSG